MSIAPVARVDRLLARSERTGIASRRVFYELSTLTGRPPVAQAAPAYASWRVDLVLAIDVVPRKPHRVETLYREGDELRFFEVGVMY